MPNSPSVVLRYRDGAAIRCVLLDEFVPHTHFLRVETEDGDILDVNLVDLKAVFFLKDPRRRDADIELGDTPPVPNSAAARVEFFDGEIMRGRVQHYSVADMGFFLYPSAPESNNERVFVVALSLSTVAIEG
jgi:hypothetical protein